MFMATKANEIQNGDLKSNIIVLRSVYGKTGQKYLIQPCRDKNRQWPECVRQVDDKDNMLLSVEDKMTSGKVFIPVNRTFVVEDGTTFDLNVPEQAAEWEAIKNCFLIAPSRDAKDEKGDYLIDGTRDPNAKQPRYGRAELYVEMPGMLSEKKVNRKKLEVQAQSLIFNDPRGYDGQLLVARVLGRNMTNQPAADVQAYLLEVATREPNKIIQLYTGGEMQLKLLFITAKEKSVIRKEHGLYVYGDEAQVTLGASEGAVIEWMKQPRNQKTLQLIRQDTFPEVYVEKQN